MARRINIHSTLARALALGSVVFVTAAAAISLHRHGHTQGDDFALYLRQARSIFDGDIDKVISDNRFAVLNSNDGFSPIGYPWGWPLILSPFVYLWGLDYQRLKLIEVALLCMWLVLVHGILRRRAGRPIAFAVVAVIGTSYAFLIHTDELLSEFPHLVAVALFVWWYDRVRSRSALIDASFGDLAALGGFVVLAFNMRREAVALVIVIAVVQLIELISRAKDTPHRRVRAFRREVRDRWRTLLNPHVTFVLGVAVFQALLPTDLFPENGNSWKYIDDRFGDYPGVLTQQLGLGRHPHIGVLMIAVAAAGVVIGVRRRPASDGLLALVAFFSALTISTHFRLVDRYWFQVTPWVLYFGLVATIALVRLVLRRWSRVTVPIGLLPALWLVVVHVVVVPSDISDARDFNKAGRIEVGPTHPDFLPIYQAVRDHTPPDAIIAYFRSRTMTLLTDRRSIQQTNLDRIRERADYFAERRGRDYWQPNLTMEQGLALGFVVVWSNSQWILWKVAPPPLDPTGSP